MTVACESTVEGALHASWRECAIAIDMAPGPSFYYLLSPHYQPAGYAYDNAINEMKARLNFDATGAQIKYWFAAMLMTARPRESIASLAETISRW